MQQILINLLSATLSPRVLPTPCEASGMAR